MAAGNRIGLTLGPLLYLWDQPSWTDFYSRIADEAEVDTVVLGEIVCSKRDHFHAGGIERIAERLTAAGKRVRLGSPALVTIEREAKTVRQLAARSDYELEAGELSAHAAMDGRPHALGPLVNVYNAPTARVLAARGAMSICLPPELPLASLRSIITGAPDIAFEVFAFGKVPLAISARCAHARNKGLVKDNCQFVCGEDPDGLPVDTLDGQHFLALNGVQTMSSTCQSLITDVPALADAGVRSLRLSPQVCDMVRVAGLFRSVADGRLEPEAAHSQLKECYPTAAFSNGFLHAAPGRRLIGDRLGAL